VIVSVMSVLLAMAAWGMDEPGVTPAMAVPGPAAEAPAAPAAAGEIRTADDLLAALERADVGLRTLTAEIRFTKTFEIAGDEQVRQGRIAFADERSGVDGAEGARKFAVRFDSLRVGDRVEEGSKTIVFDGVSLVEMDAESKTFIRRRVVRDGERMDPLKLGEGPLPLPIGQKREEILRRYDAMLLGSAEGLEGEDERATADLARFARGAHQLRLTPRADVAAGEDLTEIRLWYTPEDGGGLLPRMARTVNRAGDVSLVQLRKVVRNGAVPAGMLDVGEAPAGWDVREE